MDPTISSFIDLNEEYSFVEKTYITKSNRDFFDETVLWYLSHMLLLR